MVLMVLIPRAASPKRRADLGPKPEKKAAFILLIIQRKQVVSMWKTFPVNAGVV